MASSTSNAAGTALGPPSSAPQRWDRSPAELAAFFRTVPAFALPLRVIPNFAEATLAPLSRQPGTTL